MWKQLSSMKFAITILVVLGIASILAIVLGEFFPPNVPGGEGFYLERMGPTQFRILKALGVFDPYHSFWYVGLLFILCLSMTVCTIKRSLSMWRLAFDKSIKSDKQDILKYKNAKSVRVNKDPETVKATVSHILKKRFYRIRFEEKNGSVVWFACKGGLSRIGVILLHFGLVILFLGGLITTLLGYSLMSWGSPGDILSVQERDFQVRVDDFQILTNPQGQVKDYLCTLTVLEDGKEVRTKQIEVNKPLKYRGITFYQSSYRSNPRQVESVTLSVRGTQKEASMQIVELVKNDTKQIPGTDYRIEIADFAGNFRMDGGRVFSVPGMNEFRNPAVKLNVYDNEQSLIKSGWVFNPQMAGFHNFFEDYQFQLVDFSRITATGLNVRKNPGAVWIWIGLVLMSLGVLMVFWMTHKRIWGMMSDAQGGRTEITLGGLSNKNKTDFTREIQHFVKELKSRTTGD